MKRGDPVVFKRRYRPAIAPVCLGVPGRSHRAVRIARSERCEALISLGSHFKEGHGVGEAGLRCCGRCGILCANKRLRLCGPWHDLGIEKSPARAMPFPKASLVHGRTEPAKDRFEQSGLAEESAARPAV